MATTEWWARAACRGLGDLMFPDNSEHDIEQGRRVCTPCPVRTECLTDALRTGDLEYGIRAGLKGAERRAVARATSPQGEAKRAEPAPKAPAKKREPAKCGTRAGYQKHLREKTAICAPCRQANSDADNRLRRTGTSVQRTTPDAAARHAATSTSGGSR